MKLLSSTLALIFLSSSLYAGTELISNNSTDGVYSLRYRIDDFTLDTVSVQGKSYAVVAIADNDVKTSEKGFPAVPLVLENIRLNADGTSRITIDSVKYREIKSLPLLPSKGNLTRKTLPSSIPFTEGAVYRQNSWYPELPVVNSKTYSIRDVNGTTLRISPFSYNGFLKKMRIAEEIYFTVREDNTHIRSGSGVTGSAVFNSVFESRFLNNERQSRYAPIPDSDKMIIVTHEKYKSEADRLAFWKNRKGISTNVYLYPTETGEGVESLTQFIKEKYNSTGIGYVTLIGDYEDIPSKTLDYSGFGFRSNRSEFIDFDSEVSSDPHYVFLQGDDFYPDAFIGRISVETAEQAGVVVDKIISYEREPEVGAEWYHKAIHVGSADTDIFDKTDHEWLTDSIAPVLKAYKYTQIDTNYELINESTDMLSLDLNEGRGLLNFMGHGDNDGFGFNSGFWFDINMINSLDNGHMLPVVIPLACNFGTFRERTCAAEAWIRKEHGGAIVTMGSTPLMDWSPPQYAQVEMNRLFAREAHSSMGAYFYNGEMHMLDGGDGEKTMRTWIYFGDPSLQFFTDAPVSLELNHGSISKGEQTFTVSGEEGALVTLFSPEMNIHTSEYISGGTASFDVNVTGNDTLFVTGTKRNHAPYLASVTADGTSIENGVSQRIQFGVQGITGSGISLTTPVPGDYSISIYSLKGRLIHRQSALLGSGVNHIPFEELNHASGAVIIKIAGGGSELVVKNIIR